MHVDLKTNGYELSRLDQDRLDQAVAHLDRLTDTYATRRLHVTVERLGHTQECQVRAVLFLSRRRLIAMDRAPALAPAIQRCVDIISKKIELSKERVHRRHGEREIRRAKEEAGLFDLMKVREAHAAGDFEGFSSALGEVPEMVEAEIGRRLKFHPDAEALLEDEFVIEDLVDAVLLYAFENYAARPENVPFREWLLGSVDLCIDQLVKDVQTEEEIIRPSDQAA